MISLTIIAILATGAAVMGWAAYVREAAFSKHFHRDREYWRKRCLAAENGCGCSTAGSKISEDPEDTLPSIY